MAQAEVDAFAEARIDGQIARKDGPRIAVWIVLYIQENGTMNAHPFSSAAEAALEAATWLGNNDGEVDGYVPDMMNAAQDRDESTFVSNDRIWSVRIMERFMEIRP